MARRIEKIARGQGGHVTATQLRELGLSRRAVAGRAERGQLIRVHHGVYAVGHRPTNPLDRAHGALLAAGPRSALAGFSALALWRAERTWAEPLEVISPLDRRARGIQIRRSSTLLNRDIRSVQGLRVTSPARTALDLAPRLGRKELTRVVNELRLINRLKVHQLRDIVARNPRHPERRPSLSSSAAARRSPRGQSWRTRSGDSSGATRCRCPRSTSTWAASALTPISPTTS